MIRSFYISDFNKRLILYRRYLYQYIFTSSPYIFSKDLSRICKIHPTQIRNDFLKLGVKGNNKIGYPVRELIDKIDIQLKINQKKIHLAIIGSYEIALTLKEYFEKYNENVIIDAVFIIDKNHANKSFNEDIFFPITSLISFLDQGNTPEYFIFYDVPDASQVINLMKHTNVKKIINIGIEHLNSEEIEIVNLDIVLQIENHLYL